MKCIVCGEQENFKLDIQVVVWQRASGEFDEDSKTFFASDLETLWDSEEELRRVVVCGFCGLELTGQLPDEVVWS